MVRTGSFIATFLLIALLAVPANLGAQQPPSPAPAPSATRPADRKELRDHIYVMEGALMRAVQAGAQRLNKEIRSVLPNMMMLSGEPQALGVYLDGYGVFFNVGVPILHQSMVWSIGPMLQQEDEDLKVIRTLRARLPKLLPQDPDRAAIEAAIARLEMKLGPVSQTTAAETVTATPSTNRLQQNAVGAAMVMPESAAAPAPAPPPPAPPVLDRKYLQDPNAINRAYTDSVQKALIDSMIDYGSIMRIGADEWLTVAARDNMQRDSLAPQDPYEEVVTILLRIKGSDLAAYRAGQIDKDEVRRRVQIGEF